MTFRHSLAFCGTAGRRCEENLKRSRARAQQPWHGPCGRREMKRPTPSWALAVLLKATRPLLLAPMRWTTTSTTTCGSPLAASSMPGTTASPICFTSAPSTRVCTAVLWVCSVCQGCAQHVLGLHQHVWDCIRFIPMPDCFLLRPAWQLSSQGHGDSGRRRGARTHVQRARVHTVGRRHVCMSAPGDCGRLACQGGTNFTAATTQSMGMSLWSLQMKLVAVLANAAVRGAHEHLVCLAATSRVACCVASSVQCASSTRASQAALIGHFHSTTGNRGPP